MLRQAHHTRNQALNARPQIQSRAGSEPVEGLDQRFYNMTNATL